MSFTENLLTYDEQRKRKIDKAIDQRDFEELTKLTIGG